MNLNNNLSIIIPTYNRAQILNSWLEHHAKIMYLNNIRIHVQDNASTDNTIFILENFQKNYSNITYIKNKINSGTGNLNMQLAMNVVDTKFTWPIGDTYYISQDLLNKVILTIKNNLSLFLILNLKNRIKNINKNFIDADFACENLTGVLSCLGCVVYNRARLGSINFKNSWSYFSQVIYILNLLKLKKENAYWIPKSVDTLPGLKKTNWSNTTKVYEIGCKNWIQSVDSLKGFSFKSKQKAYRLLSDITGLFTFMGALKLHEQDLLKLQEINFYKYYLKKSVGNNYLIFYLVILIPSILLKIFKKILIKYVI
jgi:glycosyltransferase involved in cell wall biosynthesis